MMLRDGIGEIKGEWKREREGGQGRDVHRYWNKSCKTIGFGQYLSQVYEWDSEVKTRS